MLHLIVIVPKIWVCVHLITHRLKSCPIVNFQKVTMSLTCKNPSRSLISRCCMFQLVEDLQTVISQVDDPDRFIQQLPTEKQDFFKNYILPASTMENKVRISIYGNSNKGVFTNTAVKSLLHNTKHLNSGTFVLMLEDTQMEIKLLFQRCVPWL